MISEPIQSTVAQLAALLKGSHSTVVLTGAGISTPSGIPDFRSRESGLWANTDPMVVASLLAFRHNPQAFYDWLYPLADLMVKAVPNPAHQALADLEARGLVQAIITQNIDMLHTRAGSKTVYELHGHMRQLTCIHCFTVYPAEPIIAQYLQDRQVPRCPKCQSVLKPNVILFGEQLPMGEYLAAKNAARQAQLVVVVGSSLEVEPACSLPLLALQNGAKLVIINLETTPVDRKAALVIHDDAAVVLPEVVQRLEAKT